MIKLKQRYIILQTYCLCFKKSSWKLAKVLSNKPFSWSCCASPLQYSYFWPPRQLLDKPHCTFEQCCLTQQERGMAAIINSKQLFRQFMTFNHAACQPKMSNANFLKFQFEPKAPIKHIFPSKFLTLLCNWPFSWRH